jgi:single-strand DNA-binding protein
MKGLNEVKLIGNLGSDPEMRFTPTGKPVTTFTLATSRKYKDDQDNLVEDTTWHNIVCWNALAENVNKALDKGSAVYISGRIANREWVGQDGQKHYKTEIIAGDVIFLDKPKAAGTGQGDKMMTDATNKKKQSKLATAAVAMGAEPVEEKLSEVLRTIDNEGLPF